MTQTHGRAKTHATGREAERKKGPGQRFTMLTLLAAVIVVDQTAKWWAWRHVSGVTINPGGDFLTGPTIGRWYAHPVTGALLDLMSFGLMSIALAVLARRPRPAAVTVCGSLMAGRKRSRQAVQPPGNRGKSRSVAGLVRLGQAALHVIHIGQASGR
jgi:hypothetical protein